MTHGVPDGLVALASAALVSTASAAEPTRISIPIDSTAPSPLLTLSFERGHVHVFGNCSIAARCADTAEGEMEPAPVDQVGG